MGSVVKNQYAVNDVDEINTIVSSNTTQQPPQPSQLHPQVIEDMASHLCVSKGRGVKDLAHQHLLAQKQGC